MQKLHRESLQTMDSIFKHYMHIRNVWNQRVPLFNHRLCEHVKELATVCLINLPWKQINLEDFHDLLHMLCVGSLCRFLNGYAVVTPSRRKRFTKQIQSKSIVILLFTGSDLCLSVKYNNFPIIYVNILLHQLLVDANAKVWQTPIV